MNILCNFVNLDSQNLTAAIDYTGDTYNEIGDMYEKQVRNLKIAQLNVLACWQGIWYEMFFLQKQIFFFKICYFYKCSFLQRMKRMAGKSAIRMIRL